MTKSQGTQVNRKNNDLFFEKKTHFHNSKKKTDAFKAL